MSFFYFFLNIEISKDVYILHHIYILYIYYFYLIFFLSLLKINNDMYLRL